MKSTKDTNRGAGHQPAQAAQLRRQRHTRRVHLQRLARLDLEEQRGRQARGRGAELQPLGHGHGQRGRLRGREDDVVDEEEQARGQRDERVGVGEQGRAEGRVQHGPALEGEAMSGFTAPEGLVGACGREEEKYEAGPPSSRYRASMKLPRSRFAGYCGSDSVTVMSYSWRALRFWSARDAVPKGCSS